MASRDGRRNRGKALAGDGVRLQILTDWFQERGRQQEAEAAGSGMGSSGHRDARKNPRFAMDQAPSRI